MIKWTNKPSKDSKEIHFYLDDKNKKESALNVKLNNKAQKDIYALAKSLRSALLKAKSHKYFKLSVDLKHLKSLTEFSEEELTFELVFQFEFANYIFDKYKSKKADKVEAVALQNYNAPALKRAQVFAKFINRSRDLANTPGESITPQSLAQFAKRLARQNKSLKCSVLDEKQLQKMGAGAILAVGKASAHKPRLIILEYKGAGSKEKPVAIIGKGITFDTGGLDIKPAGRFADMYLDMTGAAAALNTVALAAELKLKKNLVAVVPAAENAIGKDAMRPGDIIKSLSGKTIEVGHTDAEGRLILADAITYSKKFRPALAITVATLTGAALVALGQEAHAIMSKDEDFAWQVSKWSKKVSDPAWPLPLWDEYLEIMRGTFAD